MSWNSSTKSAAIPLLPTISDRSLTQQLERFGFHIVKIERLPRIFGGFIHLIGVTKQNVDERDCVGRPSFSIRIGMGFIFVFAAHPRLGNFIIRGANIAGQFFGVTCFLTGPTVQAIAPNGVQRAGCLDALRSCQELFHRVPLLEQSRHLLGELWAGVIFQFPDGTQRRQFADGRLNGGLAS